MNDITPEPMPLSQRIRTLGLTVQVGAGKRASDDDGWEHDRYRFKLKRAGREMTGVMRMGVGHAGSPPSLEDIVNAVLLDSSCVIDGLTLREFCADLGYEDVDKGQRAYQACLA